MTSYGSGCITLWIGALSPFWMGFVTAPLIGRYGQELAYQTGCFFTAFAIAGTVLMYLLSNGNKEIENGEEITKTTPAIVFLSLLMIVILFVGVAFVGDRYSNPTEQFCHDDLKSSIDKIVVVNQGMCVKNETGLHASGRAIFK